MFRSKRPPSYSGSARTYLNWRGVLLIWFFLLTAFALGAYGAYAGFFVKEQCNYCRGNKICYVACEQCLGTGMIVASEVCSACNGKLQVSSTEACFNCSATGKVWKLFSCSVCGGDGSIEHINTCGLCSGSGKLETRLNCVACSGKGKIGFPCANCDENGMIMRMFNKEPGR